MEISDRYIIVSSVGLIAKGWRILDLEKTEFVDGLYSHEPVDECLALNKKKNGVTVIEHAAQQSVHSDECPIGGSHVWLHNVKMGWKICDKCGTRR